jgi:colanic acid/amylovoran biosynthesis glycosyltransferase
MTHAAAQALTTVGVSAGLLVLAYAVRTFKLAELLGVLKFWVNGPDSEGHVSAGSRSERLSRSCPSAGIRVYAPAPRALRLAYLTTQYPAVSHTFIRRELLELERRGHQILRLAIRPPAGPLPDPADRDEESKTLHCLAQPTVALLLAVIRSVAARPFRFLAAARAALTLARRSDRGLVRHLAYLVEAAYLLGVVRCERIKHVHVHFGTNAAAVALLMQRLGGPNYSIAIHGPGEFDAPIGLSLADKIGSAAFVTAISDFGSAQIKRWVPPCAWPKVHIIRCGVGESFVQAATPVDPDSRTFLCIGRFNAQKGHLVLLDAFERLVKSGAEARLVLAGDGELRREVETRIAALSIPDRVEITGWIDEAGVRRRIRESRAVVLSSFAEGLPVVLMETLALGRSVIATSIAGIPELVQPGVSGWLVPAGNALALADAMAAALSAPAHRLDAMAAAGRTAVIERHSTATEAAKLESLLLAAVTGHPTS